MIGKLHFSGRITNICIRNLDFFQLLENFFVSSVVAILGIRYFLAISNYPQFAKGGLHIAHMLWGGILMLVAIIILLTFLGKSIKKFAAVLAGLGFGTFIDELGKFITSDNNYFYRPAFSFIYVIFILLYLLFYSFKKYWKFSTKEYLINSMEYLKEAVILDLDSEEKKLALASLSRSDHENHMITEALDHLYRKLETIPPPKPTLYSTAKNAFRNYYCHLIEKKWFPWIVNLFFIAKATIGLLLVAASITVVVVILSDGKIELPELMDNNIVLLKLFATTLAGILIIIGVTKMRHFRKKAYCIFKKATLVSIFLVLPLSFFQNQLGALSELMFNLFVLTTLNYMIDRER